MYTIHIVSLTCFDKYLEVVIRKRFYFNYLLLLQGNVILCGLRNGAVVSVDFREKRLLSSRLTEHRISYVSSDKKVGSSKKDWFKVFSSFFKLRMKKIRKGEDFKK
jgi:hypothetical protein